MMEEVLLFPPFGIEEVCCDNLVLWLFLGMWLERNNILFRGLRGFSKKFERLLDLIPLCGN